MALLVFLAAPARARIVAADFRLVALHLTHDVVSTRALRRLLQHLRGAGKCLVISTHIMQEVEQLADEIVIVAHGRTVAHGTAAAIRAAAGSATLEDAFVALAYGEPGVRAA